MKNKKITIILDSGAFSAWTKKIDIDIDQYCSFCLQNIDLLDYIVNLDVIPGEFGQKNIPLEEVERSAQKGYKNYQYMLSKGIPKEKLIHVFHQNENFKWLKKMVEEIPYIGISPANDRTTNEKFFWLEDCMKYVCDKKGYPKVKFHGFGVTSFKLMRRFPWYSVDSTSWIMTSRTGTILIPPKVGNKWSYDRDPLKISISEKSPKQSDAGQHYTNLPLNIQKALNEYLEERGFTIEELAKEYVKRDLANLEYFQDFEKAQPQWPWPYKPKKKSRAFF